MSSTSNNVEMGRPSAETARLEAQAAQAMAAGDYARLAQLATALAMAKDQQPQPQQQAEEEEEEQQDDESGEKEEEEAAAAEEAADENEDGEGKQRTIEERLAALPPEKRRVGRWQPAEYRETLDELLASGSLGSAGEQTPYGRAAHDDHGGGSEGHEAVGDGWEEALAASRAAEAAVSRRTLRRLRVSAAAPVARV
eukprot:COSAG01_NODE_338_length_18671_cov_259.238154_17_plen_197_part_00